MSKKISVLSLHSVATEQPQSIMGHIINKHAFSSQQHLYAKENCDSAQKSFKCDMTKSQRLLVGMLSFMTAGGAQPSDTLQYE